MATSLSPSAASVGSNDTVSTPHPSYDRMKLRWEKCRALMDGTQAIRDGEEDYLPRFESEPDDSYEARTQMCALFNGYERTVYACVGLLLEKDPELGDDMSAKLKAIAEDVDLEGMHLSVYAKQRAIDGMVDGFAGTFVDYPVVPNAAQTSQDEEQRLGLRPYFVKYEACDMLKVLYGKIGGVKVKTLVVLREVTEELVGDFGIAVVTRYRVYRHDTTGVHWEVWKSQEGGSVASIETERTPMRGVARIPFSIFVAGRKVGEFEYRPTLENLADLNIEHHQLKTNLRNLETLACVPTQVRIGAMPDADGKYPDITLGVRKTIEAPHIQGVPKPVYWHSPDVTVLEPGSRSLQDIKADMGAVGLAFLTPDKRAAETAAAKRIDSAAQNATLSSVSRAMQDHLEEVFGFAAEYLKEKAGSITMNREFEQTVMDAAMVTALVNAKANGGLDIETLIDLLERGRILPEGTDKAAIVKRILLENALPDNPTPRDPNAPALPDSLPPGSA
jgi:hypothetical protein